MKMTRARILVAGLYLIVGLGLLAWRSEEVAAVENRPLNVLLIYDSLGYGTSKEGNVELLQRQLAAFDTSVTLLSAAHYSQGYLNSFDKVAIVRNSADLDLINQALADDLVAYGGNLLQIGGILPDKLQAELGVNIETSTRKQTIRIAMGELEEDSILVRGISFIHPIYRDNEENELTVERIEEDQYLPPEPSIRSFGVLQPYEAKDEDTPFAVMNGSITYAPYFEKGNFSGLAMTGVLKEWLGVEVGGSTYLLFKEIYPFSDLGLLADMADELYAAGIPFIVSVRPVFDNLDYPAMLRYLETIKYVQSRNGSIIVNVPVIASTIGQNDQTLRSKMTAFIDALGNHGIAPLGVGAELYWSYDNEYAPDGMVFFDSAVLYPNRQIMHRSQSNTSYPFTSVLYSIGPEELDSLKHNGKIWGPFSINLALTMDFPETGEQMREMITTIKSRWILFSDYKMEEHTTITQEYTINSGETLTINGEPLPHADAIRDVDSEFEYVDKGIISFTKLFNVQNKVFIVIICLALLLFGVLFIAGYRLYKRKYMK